ncbi:kinase-like protein, partial [Macrolepiota fuliginosa MF-IS2]
MSHRRSRNDSNVTDADSQRQQRRPASIGELAEWAIDFDWDPSREFKPCLRMAERSNSQAKAQLEQDNLESAFMYFARTATIVLEKLPIHPDYNTALSELQRQNLGLNGQDILDQMKQIKPILVDRFNEWRAVHPNSPLAPLDELDQQRKQPERHTERVVAEEAAQWRQEREERQRRDDEAHVQWQPTRDPSHQVRHAPLGRRNEGVTSTTRPTANAPVSVKHEGKERILRSRSPFLSEGAIINLLHTRVLCSKVHYQALLQTTGAKAQKILDIIHKLLASPDLIDGLIRRSFLMALLRLAAACGQYPQQLRLDGVQCEPSALTAGRFGEVYRGQYKGQKICPKIFKLYERSQVDHLNKVQDVLCGLQYLHQNQVVHGDLKGLNILVDMNMSARLADFGLSSVMDADVLRWTSLETMTRAGGTTRWVAPEMIEDSEDGGLLRPSFASDIYSLASVIIEIFTGKIPFCEIHNDITVLYKVMRGIRPTRPAYEMAPELTNDIWEIMQDCWSATSANRPTVDEVMDRLLVIAPFPSRPLTAEAEPWINLSSQRASTLSELDQMFLVNAVSTLR